ncbi:hypothetical protein MKW98_005829 [Papaver atlanticum]|uniref:Uncharacterized protein n=1 Tax=Papaver atlanticum TaxID=357466 RepID=A0AAD4TB19_9MAGN|nr:hypothetical protein MKW98_005829 [Papaver atlanticum]
MKFQQPLIHVRKHHFFDATGELLEQSQLFNWADHWDKQAREYKEWLRVKHQDLLALDEQQQVLSDRNIKSRSHQKAKHTVCNFPRCKTEMKEWKGGGQRLSV